MDELTVRLVATVEMKVSTATASVAFSAAPAAGADAFRMEVTTPARAVALLAFTWLLARPASVGGGGGGDGAWGGLGGGGGGAVQKPRLASMREFALVSYQNT